MASMTSKIAMAIVALAVMMVALGGVEAQGGPFSCLTGISKLAVCAPYVLPGNTTEPSSDCCSALGDVDHDCLCSTLRIAYQLPAQCQLPAFNCPPSA